MKCPACSVDNKETAKNCKKCGAVLNVLPMWSVTWQWHAKVLGTIYVALIVLFFVLDALLKPYMRNIPSEVTPWLHKAQEIHK